MKIECPECKTAYETARLGIALLPEQSALVTVKCPVCKKDFDARIEPEYMTDEIGWFSKYIMRRQPRVALLGHKVTDSKVR